MDGDLDPEQQEAVLSKDGVVQVIAPAGSGKTTVLVSRVRELVSRGVPPNRILCCTFNKAAAEEMQSRLDQAGIEGVNASTFHAAGRAVLKRAELLRPDVGPTSYAQWRRLAKLAMDATSEGIWIEAPDASDQISDLKLGQMVTVDEYGAIASTPAERTLATLYRLYEEALAEQDRNDFDDHIFGAVRLLQRDAEARSHWQGEYSAILVDEYQDIEPAQERLVQMLAAPEDLLLCVGDEDQCLYAWRRASVERVIELDQLYPGLERHALARNYRCPSLVVDASRSLIARNRRRFPKQIVGVRLDPGEIVLTAASDVAAQAAQAGRLVKGVEQGQAVVLARTTRVLSEIALGLAQAGIRYFGPDRIKRQTGEPADLLAYMRLFGSPGRARPDDVDRVFRVPNRYLPDDAEINVASGLRAGLTFSQSIARLKVREAWRREKLTEAGELFDRLSAIADAGALVHMMRTEGGLDRHYADAEQLNPTDKSAVDTLAHAEETAAGMDVMEYADALDYEANIIEQHFDKNGIELATIHGAKGRQWPLVIVAGMQEDELPHARSVSDASDPEGELEGERRLAYVALTRASQRLVLLHSADRPSRFIAEAALQVPAVLPEDSVEAQVSTTTEPWNPQPANQGSGSIPQSNVSRPNSQAWNIDPTPKLASHIGISSEPAMDGSVPCSMPGCSGLVAAPFVQAIDDGFGGLCPRFEVHESLALADPGLESIWIELKRVSDSARRKWRVSTLGDDGALDCALPGCGGIVNPEYAFERDGQVIGLCAQRALHEALARRDQDTRAEYRRLVDDQRASRTVGGLDTNGRKAQLLAEGGIPCAIPGCDGIVGAAYLLESDDGPTGICGIAVAHMRLIEVDPEARAVFNSLVRLRSEQRGRWSAPGADSSADDTDLDDLPF